MQLVLSVLDILKKYGVWVLLFLIVLYFLVILLDEDRSALFRSKIYKIVHSITGQVEQEKKYISNDIKGKLNLARRKMHFGRDILPRAVDISWVSGAKGTVHDIKEGEFVVRLDPGENQSKNISLLARALVKRTTLLGVRYLVEKPIETAIDLNLVRNLLGEIGKTEVLDWYLSNEYIPNTAADAQTKHRSNQITVIDERGLFTRLLLVELEAFGKKIAGKAPRPYMVGEIEGLIDFLYQVCNKKFGERVPLDYDHAIISIGIIIFAETSKALGDMRPYIKAMEVHLKSYPTAIYVLAFNKEWLGESDPKAYAAFEEQMKKLGTEFERATIVEKTHDITYACIDRDGKRRTARLIRYVPPKPKG